MWNCGVVISASFIFCIPCDIVGKFWHNRQEDDKRGNEFSSMMRKSQGEVSYKGKGETEEMGKL